MIKDRLRRKGLQYGYAPSVFLIALSRRLTHNIPMLSKVCSAAVNGIEAYPVEVEVNAGYDDSLIVIIETI